MTKKLRLTVLAVVAMLGVSACGTADNKNNLKLPQADALPAGPAAKLLDQGPRWDARNRAAFYTQDQGSRIMPIAWFKALRRADDTPFAADRLARYGYLENGDTLPVGFTTAMWRNVEYVGMTCAACHTREIRVDGAAYRVDGGPALSDLQGLFADMDAAVQKVLATDAAFMVFAADVLGKNPAPAEVAQLRSDLTDWAMPYHTLMSAALPAGKPWGVGRADAVGMILNRLGGLDIGPGPDHLIAGNIRPADAPVRYPFLWNAPVQNKTQWPGFAPNGNDLFGLIRNLGEVYGVFGVLYPERRVGWVGGIDYISTNSGNFSGLDRVEQMARRIGKPAWPWKVDSALAAQGEKLFMRKDGSGQSCASCHGIVVQHVPPLPATWKTPLFDVQTDSHEYDTLAWDGDSGVLEGGYLLVPVNRIKPRDSLVAMLSIATAGAILQKAGVRFDPASTSLSLVANNPKKNQPLVVNAIRAPASAQANAAPDARYESRVMEGIWAAAPYLHNGSVPTLADLLEPTDKRPARFDVGADYDTIRIGLAAAQTGLHSTTETTGCEDRGSGNSRCGHEFGTGWTPDEKRALLEYLKIL